MLVRNYAKPFCIIGFILAEIYMLFVVLAPYGHERGRTMPVPIPMEEATAPLAPVPASHMVARVLVCSIFFGPFGALVGLGAGLAFSGVMQAVRGKNEPGQKN
jgi:hypothetical protein